jgi:glycosyltransferase involved in cell wall biosynthesis
MRLVIDLQGAQGASRLRGIGRLSRELALAMAREGGDNEVLVALNGAFPDAADDLVTAFAGILGRDAIRIWHPTGRTAATEPSSRLRLTASERIRAQFLQSLTPDLVHVSSLFEGADDDIVTSLPPDGPALPSIATLYDLIPLIRREQYLDGAWVGAPLRDWYLRKVEQLCRMPGLLAISESSRNEAIVNLGTPPDRVFNIRAGVADSFRPVPLHGEARRAFLARYGLSEGYVLFLGGGDLRKNEAGLIAAFGLLPPDLCAAHKLAIVGKVDEAGLRAKAAAAGIAAANLILIPFVEEADLPAIYSTCTLFVFPSLHEGFGLPAAEAMACGAPVIGSNCTSVPEVIGRADALFDPHTPRSIARLMQHTLTDDGFRRSLAEHGPRQAGGFTWADSAKRAWSALESIADQTRAVATTRMAQPQRRLSLAMTSPLPPQHTGIADYTHHLLPALARYYDITLVTAELDTTDPALRADFEILTPAAFAARAGAFDRVLHQLGNSEFHRFQIDTLLPQSSGVVVLHDVFLSNILRLLEQLDGSPERFRETLLLTHGIRGVQVAAKYGADAAVQQFPCSLRQIRQSIGVIVHSRHAQALIESFYGSTLSGITRIVPTTRELPKLPSRAEARARLNLADSTTVVATFGTVADTKMPQQILVGFAASNLAQRGGAVLTFVGEADGAIAEQLTGQAQAVGVGASVVLTQRTTSQTYHNWLAAADIAVQLRTGSRGETSAAAADCLAAGLPMIVNTHGALPELPTGAVIMLPDRFGKAALATAIDRLAEAPDLRRSLGDVGRDYANTHLSAKKVAREYHEAIEAFYAAQTPAVAAQKVLQALHRADVVQPPDASTIQAIGRALSWSFPLPRPRRLMLDITAWSEPRGARRRWSGLATALLSGTAASDRGELLDWRNRAPVSAWGEATRLLSIEELADAPARPTMRGDLLLCPMQPRPAGEPSLALARWAHRGGARVVALAWSRDDLAAAETRADIDVTVTLDEAPGAGSETECAELVRALHPALHRPDRLAAVQWATDSCPAR